VPNSLHFDSKYPYYLTIETGFTKARITQYFKCFANFIERRRNKKRRRKKERHIKKERGRKITKKKRDYSGKPG